MKKLLLSFMSLLVVATGVSIGQNKFEGLVLNNGKYQSQSNYTFGQPKFDRQGKTISRIGSKTRNASADVIQPVELLSGAWSTWENFDTKEVIPYYFEETTVSDPYMLFFTSLTISEMGTDFSKGKSVSVAFPGNANRYDVQDRNSTSFVVFVHYFEGQVGPDYQRNEIWIVSLEDGTILKKFTDSTVAMFIGN